MKQNENQRISNQFGGFCSKVLKNESRSIHAIYARQRKRETSLTELSREELLQLSAEDKYFNNIHIFKVMDNLDKLPENNVSVHTRQGVDVHYAACAG